MEILHGVAIGPTTKPNDHCLLEVSNSKKDSTLCVTLFTTE